VLDSRAMGEMCVQMLPMMALTWVEKLAGRVYPSKSLRAVLA
jgi:hypothetical protein